MSTIFVWHSQYQLFGMDSKMTSSTEGPHRKKGHDRKSARTEQLLGSVRQFFGSCCLLKNPNFFVFWQKNVAERNWFLSFVQNILDLAKFVRCLLLGNRLSTFVSRCLLSFPSFFPSFFLPPSFGNEAYLPATVCRRLFGRQLCRKEIHHTPFITGPVCTCDYC